MSMSKILSMHFYCVLCVMERVGAAMQCNATEDHYTLHIIKICNVL